MHVRISSKDDSHLDCVTSNEYGTIEKIVFGVTQSLLTTNCNSSDIRFPQ